MKFRYNFLFRKPDTKNSNVVDDDTTGESIMIPTIHKDGKKRVWFLFRIIRPQYHKSLLEATTGTTTNQQQQQQPTTGSDNGGGGRTTTSVTPSSTSNTTPISFIQFVQKEDGNNSDDRNNLFMEKATSFIKLTQTNELMERHGLSRDDSILPYMKDVDTAMQKIVFTLPDHQYDNDDDRNDKNNNDDDEYETDDRLYTTTDDDMFYGVSVLTMDPALLYSHSIVLDEYSWKSFRSISKNEYEDSYLNTNYIDDDDDDDDDEEHATPIRYYNI